MRLLDVKVFFDFTDNRPAISKFSMCANDMGKSSPTFCGCEIQLFCFSWDRCSQTTMGKCAQNKRALFNGNVIYSRWFHGVKTVAFLSDRKGKHNFLIRACVVSDAHRFIRIHQ